MNPIINKRILRFKGGQVEALEDTIAAETKVKIIVNGSETVSLAASPTNIKELITGYLMTEGILKGDWCPEKISIEISEKEVKAHLELEGFISLDGKTITSGCMSSVSFLRDLRAKINDNIQVEPNLLFSLFRDFQQKSILYRTTGCIHSAAIAEGRDILFIAEDVGRHNAVDKVIGWAILNKIPFTGKIMLLSGRISSEMVLKVAKWKIPVVVSRSAPTSLAVEIAENTGVTLVGFLRGDRFNVYSTSERIKRYEQK